MTGIKTRPGTSGDGGLVVVPRQAGPLEPLGGRTRADDDLDAFVDDMFGESTSEGPGIFDLALLALGAAAVAGALLTGAGAGWVALGVVLLVLGLALPARSALGGYQSRKALATRRRASARGYLLDTSASSTGALAAAYEALIGSSGGSGSPLADRAVGAAHAAVVEVATLLDGAAPVTDAEDAYVEKRTKAIRDTTAQLIRVRRARSRADGAETDDETVARRRSSADALIAAREELESTHGMGSVDQLETLRDLLRREGDDAAG